MAAKKQNLMDELVLKVLEQMKELPKEASEVEQKIAIKIAINKAGVAKRLGTTAKVDDKGYTVYNQKAQPKKVNEKSLLAILNHNIKMLSDGEKSINITEARKVLNSGGKVHLDSASSTTKRYITKNKKDIKKWKQIDGT